MAKEFDMFEETKVHSYYQFPDWINNKYLCDIKNAMDKDKLFRYRVLYMLLEQNKDDYDCSNLQKFFDSWVYGYNVYD